jgi:peptidoglycan hydrolase CwlO-like protein
MALKPYRESERVADVEEETVKDRIEQDFIDRMGPVLKQALREDFDNLHNQIGEVGKQIGSMDKRLQSIEASSSSTAAYLSNISKQIEELVKKISGRQAGSAA